MARETRTLRMLPPAPDRCPVCAAEHDPDEPHDKHSMYYQMAFHGQHGRWPTWGDALAHCEPEMRQLWVSHLRQMEDWDGPPAGADVMGALDTQGEG